MTAMYALWHKPQGLQLIAKRLRFRAEVLRDHFRQLEIVCVTHPLNFFDTLTIDVKASGFSSADYVLSEFHKHDINLRKVDENHVGISINEQTTIDDLATLIEVFAYIKDQIEEVGDYLAANSFEDLNYRGIPANLSRKSEFMQQEIFHTNISETEMMRYCCKLGDKDYSLVNGMVPLGSCTMKLNSAIVMTPITYPGFANVHPFVPKDQAVGYMFMIKELERMLSAITHFHRISLQPNSGANGEYAGIMAIMKYHASRQDFDRKLCIIPTSAHGTNPASANMCGLTIVGVNCDEEGNIDMEDFRAKIKKYNNKIACAMFTYPSTYGVFDNVV